MALHPNVARAFEEIDAGIYSGDQFDRQEDYDKLEMYVIRWVRALPEIRQRFIESPEHPGSI